MKYLSPQQAMLGMRVVLTDNGMIIKSPAGSAEYNLKGRRIKVTGYPEYFPGLLSVKDQRTKTGGWVNISAGEFTAYREDGSVSARIGRINPLEEQKLVGATANWSTKVNTDEIGHRSAAGMGVAVEGGKEKVELKADRFAVTGTAQSIIENAQAMNNARIHAAECKTRLSDEMREAVIDAIRESDVFRALQASQDAQASAQVTMQLSINKAVTDAIRNALKPGGLLYRR